MAASLRYNFIAISLSILYCVLVYISSSKQLAVSFPKESSNVGCSSSGKKSSPNSDTSTSDSGRGQSCEDACPAEGHRPRGVAPTAAGSATVAAPAESHGQPKTRMVLSQAPFVVEGPNGGLGGDPSDVGPAGCGLVLQEKGKCVLNVCCSYLHCFVHRLLPGFTS